MHCTACGNQLADGSAFCEFCGADQRVSTASATAQAVATGSQAPSSSPPTRTEIGGALLQNSRMLVGSLSLGEKLASVGVVASVLGFFLPWVSTPNLSAAGQLSPLLRQLGAASTKFSGLDVAKLWGGVYFVLVAAVISGVLLFSSGKAAYARRLVMNGFQVMIGSVFGPAVVFVLLFVPLAQTVAGLGIWLTGLGFCSVAAGGLVTISRLGKSLS